MKNRLYISIGVLAVLILFYILNINQQKNYQSTSSQIFDFNQTQVNSFLIKSESATIEIQRVDTSWAITNNDSLVLKENILNTFFDKIFGPGKVKNKKDFNAEIKKSIEFNYMRETEFYLNRIIENEIF